MNIELVYQFSVCCQSGSPHLGFLSGSPLHQKAQFGVAKHKPAHSSLVQRGQGSILDAMGLATSLACSRAAGDSESA